MKMEPIQKRVLLVEPYEDSGEMLALLLKHLGHAVRRVRNGRQALATVRAVAPDIVFTELVMPDMCGVALCTALRALPAMRASRIVALSGYCLARRMPELQSAGFDAFLLKPACVETLMEALAA